MAAQFVTLQQAKDHLRLTTPEGHVDDPDLQLKLDAAEAAILRFIARTAAGSALVDGWLDDADAPADLVHLVLVQCGEFWRFRGDDPGAINYSPTRNAGEDFSPVVLGLLRRFGDPVIA
jgi:hypothetical protein